MVNLVLGVEGGATKTEWIYMNVDNHQREVLQHGRLPAANFRLISADQLLLIFSLLPKDATKVGLYLPGVLDNDDRKNLSSLARTIWPLANISVGSDRESGLATAFGQGPGIFVISGTGSAVTGRNNGAIVQAGGKGHLLGDKGSAYHVGIESLRLLMDRYDESEKPCQLASAILRELGLNRVDDIISWVQKADKQSVARIATTVFEIYEAGDHQLLDILKAGAESLAHSTVSVAKRLGMTQPHVALHGSMFTKRALYVQLYKDALKIQLPDAKVTVCNDSGSKGAAYLAEGSTDTSNFPTEEREERVTHELKEITEMKTALTEQRNDKSIALDSMTPSELVDLFVEEEKCVYEALKDCQVDLSQAVEIVVSSLRNGGRLFYVGAGTSGRLGMLDASEIPPTFGEPPTTVQGIIAGGAPALQSSIEGAEDDPVMGALAIIERGISNVDVVCGITACGRTPFVLGALDKAKELGAKTLLVTSNPNRPNKDTYHKEIVLVTGPELVTGSTRLKAGTATKVTLNIITSCSMVLLGKVKSNLMVGLKATNAKLQDRAIRLVAQFNGWSYEEAYEQLQKASWNVQTLTGNHFITKLEN